MDQQPYQQVPPAPTTGRWGASTLLSNLGAEVMGGLSYVITIVPIVGFILQIVIFATEKNRFVKFHAAQAMILSIVSIVLYVIVNVFSVGSMAGLSSSSSAANLAAGGTLAIVGCVAGLVGLVLFGFWLWGMISAFTGKATKLPLIGSLAEGLAGGPVAGV